MGTTDTKQGCPSVCWFTWQITPHIINHSLVHGHIITVAFGVQTLYNSELAVGSMFSLEGIGQPFPFIPY